MNTASTLQNIRETVIKSFITQELLDESVYPSLDLVCAILMRDYKNYNIASSLLLGTDGVSGNDSASKSYMKDLLKRIKIDIKTLYLFADYLNDYIETANTVAANKISALNFAINDLLVQIKELSLINENINQDVTILTDNFDNTTKIDSTKTDAYIDLNSKTVSAKDIYGVGLKSILPILNTSSVSEAMVTYGYLYAHSQIGFEAPQIASNNGWLYKIVMPVSYNSYVEAAINIGFNSVIDISRLRFLFTDNGKYKVKLTALINGTYTVVSDFADFQEVCDISFNPIKTNLLILNVRAYTNYGIDFSTGRNGNLYKIAIKNLQYTYQQYADVSYLYTADLDAGKQFSTIGLWADESIPIGTGIKYEYSSFLNNIWSNYIPIEPYNRVKIDYSKYQSVFAAFPQVSTAATVDFTKTHAYLFGQNIATTATIDSLSFLRQLNPLILRNLGGIKIESVASNLASVVLYVNGSTTIDFSRNPGYIISNGYSTYVTGNFTLQPGIYQFKFTYSGSTELYKAFLASYSSSVKFGSHLATYVDPSLFVNVAEDNKYDVFTFINISGTLTAIVKLLGPDVVVGGSSENLLYIKNNTTSSNLANIMPTKIRLKIEFDTNNTLTPILSGYKIKLL